MKLYNSLTRTVEEFTPLDGKNVTLYVCGITPYDTTHLGHAFTYVSFDVLIRYLTYKGYEVNYTQNVTDIDNDILKRARMEKKDWRKLGDFWTEKFLKDLHALNVLPPTNFVKATHSIPKMIEMIHGLLKKGHAYVVDGIVYFDTTTFKNYGKLSQYTQKQMLLIAKERGGSPDNPKQKNPLDFVLWQKALEGEPSWNSPWGKGRPGWHIECSAMVHEFLGPQIDIHGGGRDLIFPHHDSEIAQSESYTGKVPYVSYWMHVAMVEYQGEKMSKSLGNMVMIRDLLRKYSPQGIRMYLLSNHYRKPWEYDEHELVRYEQMAKKIIARCSKDKKANRNVPYEFVAALQNDFDTPKALQILEDSLTRSSSLVKPMASLLGLL